MFSFTIFIIFIALVFDFLNGFHDAANSIATVVSTRVLTPAQAVIWAAFFNFIAAFLFGTSVAGTIGNGLSIRSNAVDVYVVFAGLMGAIIWNIITWLLAPADQFIALRWSAARGGGDRERRIWRDHRRQGHGDCSCCFFFFRR